jgi:hypothetical protein
VGEKERHILEGTRGNVRCRVLAEEHFEFRGGGSAVSAVGRHVLEDYAQVPLAREARLRPEYAPVYPCLTPDIWQTAAVVTEKVMAWQGYPSRRVSWVGRLRSLS